MENRVTGFGALQSVLAPATDSMISFGMWLEVKTYKVELVIALRQEASLTFIYLIVAGNRDFDHEGFVAPSDIHVLSFNAFWNYDTSIRF